MFSWHSINKLISNTCFWHVRMLQGQHLCQRMKEWEMILSTSFWLYFLDIATSAIHLVCYGINGARGQIWTRKTLRIHWFQYGQIKLSGNIRCFYFFFPVQLQENSVLPLKYLHMWVKKQQNNFQREHFIFLYLSKLRSLSAEPLYGYAKKQRHNDCC